MADPISYTPSYSFTDYQEGNPRSPLPGNEVDSALFDISHAIDSHRRAIRDVRRSDGALKNLIVTYDSLSLPLRAKLYGQELPEPPYPLTSMFNVLDYDAVADFVEGADPDDMSDNTLAFQKAMDDARVAGSTVFVPAGHYYFARGSAPLDPGVGGFSIVGEYGGSVLHFHEGTSGSPKTFMSNIENVTKSFLFFQGITFKGTFGDMGRTAGSNYIGQVYLDHYEELRFSYCRWENIFTMATDLHFNGAASWDHCDFIDIAADGARARESFYVQVTNNYFCRLGDDAVALHGGKYTYPGSGGGYDPEDGSPRREGLIVSGNIFRDTSAPITILGARQALVANNHANRFRTYFVYIDNAVDEGTHPEGNIKIIGNTGLNCITSIGSYVVIGAGIPRGSTATGNVVPGQPHVTTGLFEHIWDHQLSDINVATHAFPPIENVEISNNTFGRSIAAVAKYSDLGFGRMGSATFTDDIAVTDALLRPPNAMYIAVGKVTKIDHNILSHSINGILLEVQDEVSPAGLGSEISHNTITNFTATGIAASGIVGKVLALKVADNVLDGDIERLNAFSNADGTYDSAIAGVQAFDFGTNQGVAFTGNTISNVARVLNNTNAGVEKSRYDQHFWKDNTIICGVPSALGFHASHKGVGNLPSPAIGFNYTIQNCDPTAGSSYGVLENVMVQSGTVIPTTGYYLPGHRIENTNPTREDRNLLKGWTRASVGNAHVIDVDWLADWSDARNGLQEVANWTPNGGSAIATATRVTTTIAVAGAVFGAFVDISFGADQQGCDVWGYISAADTVTVVLENNTGSNKTFVQTAVRAIVRLS